MWHFAMLHKRQAQSPGLFYETIRKQYGDRATAVLRISDDYVLAYVSASLSDERAKILIADSKALPGQTTVQWFEPWMVEIAQEGYSMAVKAAEGQKNHFEALSSLLDGLGRGGRPAGN